MGPGGRSLLWRYNLHYWEWDWAFVGEADRGWARDAYAALWQGWARSSPFVTWPGWASYPVWLRAWARCGQHAALVAGHPGEERFCELLGEHTVFLRHNLEYDVGGNHLAKNLKGLVGLAVFFDDSALVDQAVARIEEPVRAQVLADGGHYERSPSYTARCWAISSTSGVSWPPPVASSRRSTMPSPPYSGGSV